MSEQKKQMKVGDCVKVGKPPVEMEIVEEMPGGIYVMDTPKKKDKIAKEKGAKEKGTGEESAEG